jgi:hypothetical protein
VATSKLHLNTLDGNLATGVAFGSARLLAKMLAAILELRAGLHAKDCFVEHI